MKELMKEAFRFVDDQALVLSRYGLRLSKEKERLVVREKDRVLAELPFFKVKSVTFASRGISLSTNLLEALASAEVEILFLGYNGKPYGSFVGAGYMTSAALRREQYRAFDNYRGAYLSRTLALAKVRNQARLLQYYNRHEKSSVISGCIDRINEISETIEKQEGPDAQTVRNSVMGYEGSCARIYWSGVIELIGDRTGFSRRDTRNASDIINYCLNYGYAILYGEMWRALLRAGLDPYAGFLHADRDGKPSLVFDFAEEFRQPLVDRALISSIRKGWKPGLDKDGKLNLETRKHLLDLVKNNLERENYSVSRIIFEQARALADYLRDKGMFTPHPERWW